MEGRPYRSFLHLEDVRQPPVLETLLNQDGFEVKETDGILEILFSYYQDLYEVPHGGPSQDGIN